MNNSAKDSCLWDFGCNVLLFSLNICLAMQSLVRVVHICWGFRESAKLFAQEAIIAGQRVTASPLLPSLLCQSLGRLAEL